MQSPERLSVPASAEVWCVDLAQPAPPDALATLSDGEREIAQRFVFERDRRRYGAAHVALRALLSVHAGVAAQALTFKTGPHGKPRLAGDTRVSFNLSHSEDVALVAIADRTEIGIDVECLRAIDDVDMLAAHTFCAREQRELASTPAADRGAAFLRAWTRKEACLKAIGLGLNIEPNLVETGLSPEPRNVHIDTPQGRQVLRVVSFKVRSVAVGALASMVIDGA